ncbi:2',3'-cyclic-nucleotide 2'-phosphodiesterase/3'-nucleotidase [Paenibacillus castaneae]|uniref:bifunctional metallophosphatase/5'-nucleotidase n=1 Tax=Paenibacillus castaneae TaxID=474957 RepID=UPI001FBAC781|nr:bifunctional UDP-sugar hydrolase/5'-nucleotidase [Paenibacillus castaneae]NIK79018.1 2',3'-cyclic-nucleotide 2'-phosphodiesterase/3'-nucleotidase [Paenibacillus castaneae]
MNKEMEFNILVTSDIHGHIYPTDYRTDEERQIGIAKLAAFIKQERSKNAEVLLVDNGDLIQGTPLASYVNLYAREAIHPAVAVLNELGYDAAVVGNHEFNYGMDVLRKVMGDSEFPWLSAGILSEATNSPAFGKPYIVKHLENGIKVALLGVTTHYIPNWETAENIKGLKFNDALETVKAWTAYIREKEKPDLLVVAYHGGFERDLKSGEPAERLTGENQGYAMCTEVEGIDVLITGHQHRMLADEVNGVTIIQTGCNGMAVGKISVVLIKENDTWKVKEKRAELLRPSETIAADSAIMALTQEVETAAQAWLDQPIGQVIGDMSISSALECRKSDHPFIAFINKVQMDAADVEISNTSLLSNESRGFGSIVTMRDVLTNFMYPNTLTVLRLTGRDIREALEQTAAYFQVGKNGEVVVNPAYLEPKAQHYNYDMWGGIQYELNVAKPIGERVVYLKRNGESLDPAAEYDVVMNNYRASGGGDYLMYREKPVIREIATEMAELMANYMLQHGSIQASNEQKWRVVAEPVV